MPRRSGQARFPIEARLRRPRDYSRVFARPRKSADSLFTVLARSGPEDGARLGLAVPKRHLRRAVDRNRVKRLIRESFRMNRSALAGLDLVVIARRGITGRTNADILASLTRHWRRITRNPENC